MDWTLRQRAHGSCHSTLWLLSVLALLAFSCFPVLAQAEDSTGAQYNPALKGPGNKPPSKKSEQIAEKSESPNNSGGATAPPTGGGGSGSSESGGGYTQEAPSSGKGGQGTATSGKGGGTGQGSPEKGSGEKGGLHGQASAPASSAAADDGGSSPLVPILIGILALAAISIGAYLIRQRRHRDPGSPSSLSTKAG